MHKIDGGPNIKIPPSEPKLNTTTQSHLLVDDSEFPPWVSMGYFRIPVQPGSVTGCGQQQLGMFNGSRGFRISKTTQNVAKTWLQVGSPG